MAHALTALSQAGVAVWLDDLSRDRLRTGDLDRLVRERSVVGVTSNPTTFAAAVERGDAYKEQIRDLARRGVSVGEAVRSLATYDIRWACDVLRPTYESTGRVDGRVSLEVDPGLAHDTETTVAEARALWWMVDRPNLLIKIPATVEGLPAITRALSEGISVNVTLIFSLARYRAVLDAFQEGLELARARGVDLASLTSVASFFVSRVDAEVDRRLDEIATEEAAELRGRAALANARLAYAEYLAAISTERWYDLAAAGARPQRPLWASTGVKDPGYDDTRYVTGLVAADTVNTMPEATLEAMAGHGSVAGDTVTGTADSARADLDALAAVGVDYDDVVAVLESEGVAKFDTSWRELLNGIARRLKSCGG
jgi:transaldolase